MSRTIDFDRLTSQIAHKGSCVMVEYLRNINENHQTLQERDIFAGRINQPGKSTSAHPIFFRLVHWSLSPSVVDTPTTFAWMTISLYFTWYLLINFFSNFPGSIPFLESNCGNSSNSQDSLRQPMENHLGGLAISEMKGARLLEAVF